MPTLPADGPGPPHFHIETEEDALQRRREAEAARPQQRMRIALNVGFAVTFLLGNLIHLVLACAAPFPQRKSPLSSIGLLSICLNSCLRYSLGITTGIYALIGHPFLHFWAFMLSYNKFIEGLLSLTCAPAGCL